jgi:hypothetical protein
MEFGWCGLHRTGWGMNCASENWTELLEWRCDHVEWKKWWVDVRGTRWAQLVEALRYKAEDRGFDSRWDHWYFRLPALGSTQGLTGISTRAISCGGKRRTTHWVDDLATFMYRLSKSSDRFNLLMPKGYVQLRLSLLYWCRQDRTGRGNCLMP